MQKINPYKDFTNRLTLLIEKNPQLIITTLSNIFTMRLIGNKTHGDLAEIAIAEFINQFMYDFKSLHVGKDLFRAKEREEDISITNEITNESFPVSLKAYGDGPLQLSTDKNFQMFPKLKEIGSEIIGTRLSEVWHDPVFSEFGTMNILPLIYNEKKQQCNILVFDSIKARDSVYRITLESADAAPSGANKGRGRKHPCFRFYDSNGDYICEVRYGGANANALQRGLWTHTKNGLKYFNSITNGWISYSHNHVLVKMFSHALISTSKGHTEALELLKSDIDDQKSLSALK